MVGLYLASPQYLADKGYKFLNTNGDWYYVLGRTPETGGGYIEKAIANAAATPFRQLPSTTYPETSLPMIGSMVAVWCDTPSEEYIEKNVFDLMELLPTTTRTISRQTSLLLEKQLLRCQQI